MDEEVQRVLAHRHPDFAVGKLGYNPNGATPYAIFYRDRVVAEVLGEVSRDAAIRLMLVPDRASP